MGLTFWQVRFGEGEMALERTMLRIFWLRLLVVHKLAVLLCHDCHVQAAIVRMIHNHQTTDGHLKTG